MDKSTLSKKLYKTDIVMLMYIASKSGFYDEFKTSTINIAEDLGISQQSASRKLSELKSQDLLDVKPTNKGSMIRLTQEGVLMLKNIKNEFFEELKPNVIFNGSLVKGFGEGKYYMEQKGYKQQFNKKLNYIPWPGTFNIRLNSGKLKDMLSNIKPITINGFNEKNRNFGSIYCYPCTIIDNKLLNKNLYNKLKQNGFIGCNNIPHDIEKDIKTNLIIPKRSGHSDDIIEIIAPVYLRRSLNVKENDEIIVTLQQNE